MKYILVINYGSDAERKRIDYAVERWSGRIKAAKPRGTVLIVEASEEVNAFLEDLHSRLEVDERSKDEKIQVYKAEIVRPRVEVRRKDISYETREDAASVEKFARYLISKLGGSYEYSAGPFKVYAAYTKKGHAKIGVSIKGNEKTKIRIFVEGYGEVVDFIAKRIDEEFRIFLGGV
ncbi:hypothetical protein DRP04_07815 [Archaeoglobales archaeon]|nr:MAG: hypothetical protein DRP04_07815 [Archaeoglobales archaeon]